MTATLGISVRHDNDALICAFAFALGSAPQPIETLGAVSDAFERHCGGFVWVHVNLSHTGAQPWLERHAGVGPVFFEALTEGSRSTRIECDGDTLFGVMNDVTFDFSFDPSDVATLWISVSPERVVTARRRPLRSVDRLRTSLRRGDRIETSVELLNHLLRDQADELQRIVRSAAERLDDIEDALLAGRHGEFNSELGRLRRLTVRLQRLLAPEPSALARTLSSPPSWVRAEDLQALHRSNEEFTLVLRDVGSLQDRIRLLLDESAARVSEENNRSLFTLTMVTVLALPINLIAGLLGMNVGGIPLAESRHGFWLMLLLIGGLTALIARFAVRRMRPSRS